MTHIVVNACSARVGGALTYLREVLPPLEQQCRARGAEVSVLVSSSSSRALVADSPVRLISHGWMRWPGFARMFVEQCYLPWLLWKIKADAVLCVGDTLPLLSRVPCVLLCRNALIYETSPRLGRMWLLSRLAGASLRRAAATVAVSKALAGHVCERFPAAQVSVIHHGSGLRLNAIPSRDSVTQHRTLLCVGSMYRHKRFELAIDGVSELRKQRVDVRLLIVGAFVDKSYHHELERLVERLELSQHVHFAGTSGPDRVAAAYRTADALLITSSTESFCHPILEGFETGVPVLAADDLEVAHEIAGDAALFFPASPSGLAEAVKHLLCDASAADALVAAGRSRALQFDWSLTARATCELLLSVARAT